MNYIINLLFCNNSNKTRSWNKWWPIKRICAANLLFKVRFSPMNGNVMHGFQLWNQA